MVCMEEIKFAFDLLILNPVANLVILPKKSWQLITTAPFTRFL